VDFHDVHLFQNALVGFDTVSFGGRGRAQPCSCALVPDPPS
jgi:hypothetical protein